MSGDSNNDVTHLMMAYTVLFCGLTVLSVITYLAVCRRMAATITSPPYAPLFLVFAAYGAILLFVVSILCGEWSGMHYIAAIGLFVVATPWILIQSALLRRKASLSAYHRFVVLAGFYFPAALAALVGLVVVVAIWHSAVTSGT